jgi:cysteinyl-tRNA synthetase
LLPYLNTLAQFRDNVRDLARSKSDHTEFLQLSDQLRDRVLPALGVYLEDKTGRSLIKLGAPRSAEELERDAREAAEAKERIRLAKEEAQRQQQQKRQEKLEKGRLSPAEWAKQSDEFSQFDAEGMPTHDKAGEELSKSRKKKLQKEWQSQEKLHQDFLTARDAGEII